MTLAGRGECDRRAMTNDYAVPLGRAEENDSILNYNCAHYIISSRRQQ